MSDGSESIYIEQFHVTTREFSGGPVFTYYLPGGIVFNAQVSGKEWKLSNIDPLSRLDFFTRRIWDRYVPPGTKVQKAVEAQLPAIVDDILRKYTILSGHEVDRVRSILMTRIEEDKGTGQWIVTFGPRAYFIPSRTDAALFACGLYDREAIKIDPHRVLHELYKLTTTFRLGRDNSELIDFIRKYVRPFEELPPREGDPSFDPEPFHGWFGLSYASYLVVPRRVLQSMPPEWQAKMVALLNELDDSIDWMPDGTVYDVKMYVDEEDSDPEDSVEYLDPNREYRHVPNLPLKNPKSGESQ